jgi:hypothetical protein
MSRHDCSLDVRFGSFASKPSAYGAKGNRVGRGSAWLGSFPL